MLSKWYSSTKFTLYEVRDVTKYTSTITWSYNENKT